MLPDLKIFKSRKKSTIQEYKKLTRYSNKRGAQFFIPATNRKSEAVDQI